MGQEYDEPAPFQFFADFQDPDLKKAVSDGRRSEFKDFDFSEVPDPEDPQTFERSKLTWANSAANRDMLSWYRTLLSLRQRHLRGEDRSADVSYENGVLTMKVPASSPAVLVQCTLQPDAGLPLNESRDWKQVLDSDEDGYAVTVMVKG